MTGSEGPPVPERAKTVLSRATSAHVQWLDGDARTQRTTWVSGLHLVEGQARLGRPVSVEIAEAAPLPVRERVLRRLRVSGWAAPDPEDETVLQLVPSAITLEEAGVIGPVDVAEFLGAEPDALACCEAALLCHLDGAHPDFVATLASLVDSRHLYEVVRVWPLRLDRLGMVLRLESAQRHHDARIPFAESVRTPQEVRVQLHDLLSEATRRRQACRTRGLARD